MKTVTIIIYSYVRFNIGLRTAERTETSSSMIYRSKRFSKDSHLYYDRAGITIAVQTFSLFVKKLHALYGLVMYAIHLFFHLSVTLSLALYRGRVAYMDFCTPRTRIIWRLLPSSQYYYYYYYCNFIITTHCSIYRAR